MREVEAERVSGAGEKTRCGREVERGTKWEPRRRSPARPRPSARGRRVRAPPLQPVRPGPLPSRPAGQAAGPALRGRARAGARGGGEGGAAGGRRPCGSSSLFFFFLPLLSFFTSFSFQTGKSVPRSGSVFPPGPSLPDPGPRSRLGASCRASAGSPLCAGGRGARGLGAGRVPAPAHGRSRPARTPRRRAQLVRGPSAAPRRPGAQQRLSGEVPAPGHRDEPPPPPPLAR